MSDATNPDHYKRLDPEPIAVIEKWNLGFHLGNAVKYIARAGRKVTETQLDDLKNARWYLNRQIYELAPDIVSTIVSSTFADAADRLERALVDLENATRDRDQWKTTARSLAQRLRNLRGVDDPEIAAILGPAAHELVEVPNG